MLGCSSAEVLGPVQAVVAVLSGARVLYMGSDSKDSDWSPRFRHSQHLRQRSPFSSNHHLANQRLMSAWWTVPSRFGQQLCIQWPLFVDNFPHQQPWHCDVDCRRPHAPPLALAPVLAPGTLQVSVW